MKHGTTHITLVNKGKALFLIAQSFILVIIIFCGRTFAAVDVSIEPNKLRPSIASDGSKLFINAMGTQLTLIGPINATTATSFRDLAERNVNLETVYIDSPGGNFESALDIALLIENRGLTLIVDGRCFSACAQLILVAAKRKIVMPNSLIAVHSLLFFDKRGGEITLHSAGESDLKLDDGTLSEMEEAQRKFLDFNNRHRIKTIFYDEFLQYRFRRKHFLNENIHSKLVSRKTCPSFVLWALDKSQLESMGLTGISGYSLPRGGGERNSLMNTLFVNGDVIFYGEKASLRDFCM